jgi:hypothetical protein
MGVVGRKRWPARLAVGIAAIILAGGLAGASGHAQAAGTAPPASTSSTALEGSGGVVFISAANAWTIGGQGGRGGFLHWNGKKWSPVPGPKLKVESIAALTAVSADSIWAVGDFLNSHGDFVPLVLHWNGKSWNRSMGVPAVPDAYLDAVAVAGNEVWAVGGTDVANPSSPPLILRLTGGRWYVVPAPANDAVLHGLAMTGPASGWAGGEGGGQYAKNSGLVLHWNGSGWSQHPGHERRSLRPGVGGWRKFRGQHGAQRPLERQDLADGPGSSTEERVGPA